MVPARFTECVLGELEMMSFVGEVVMMDGGGCTGVEGIGGGGEDWRARRPSVGSEAFLERSRWKRLVGFERSVDMGVEGGSESAAADDSGVPGRGG